MKKFLLTLVLSASTLYAGAAQSSWGLYDYQLGKYQQAANTDDVRSIASITKLFTATTILRSGLDLNERVKVTGRSGGRFPKGTMVRRIDLMKAMLISSDNLAAETLANTYPGGFSVFITETNQWVRGWGLIDTTIVDASGLSPGNQSSVNNLVTLIYKIRQYPEILNISAESNTILKVNKGKKEIKIHLKNTNPEVFVFDNIVLSKTGTTNAAGRCVVMLVEKANGLHGIVVLGKHNSKERSTLAQALLKIVPVSNANASQDEYEITFP
jgi:D-alanyl-D-alanine endopeptidase (penicillin-binding protein 7)